MSLNIPTLDILNTMMAPFAFCEVEYDADNNLDMRFLYVNNLYTAHMGKTPEQLIGKLFSQEAPGDVAWLPIISDVALGKKETQIFETYSAEGNIYMHSQIFSPKHGQAVILHNNRTQFVKTEAEREVSEQRISMMFSAMPEGVCYCQLIYDENEIPQDVNVILTNDAFELYEGFRVNTLQGNHLYKLYENHSKDMLHEMGNSLKHNQFTSHIKNGAGGRIIEVLHYPQSNNQLFVVERDVTARVTAERSLKEAHETILSGIDYASKVQKNILPDEAKFAKVFSDHSILWKPSNIVGGDIYWVKQFDEGAVLCLADCTGHGVPGALLTMLVVSVLEDAVNAKNYHDTALAVWQVEQRLSDVFNVYEETDIRNGCDIAVLFIANDKNITVSSGNISVFVCNGKEVKRYKGQKIFVGEGNLRSKEDINTIHIPANPHDKFYISSDGLFDQIGGERRRQFGYRIFEQIVLENHRQSQAVVSDKIWTAFEAHKGDEAQRDDVSLISFKL